MKQAGEYDQRGRGVVYSGRKVAAVPNLSLCMIVRNEADVLGKCLESVHGLVDEVVVVDTGSEDETRKIAEEWGADVFEYTWTDNFSAARNYALEHATGDWILMLDADEILSTKDHKSLKSMLMDDEVDAFSLVQRTYGNHLKDEAYISSSGDTYTESRPYYGWIPSRLVRLFRNRPNYRFRYRIHEVVEPSIIGAGGVIKESGIPIHHFTYEKDPEFIDEKHNYYVELGLRQIKDTPFDPKPYQEVALVYMGKGLIREAEELLQRGVSQSPDSPVLHDALGTLYLDCGRIAEAEKFLLKGLACSPDDVIMLNKFASVNIAQRNYTGALSVLEKAKTLQPGMIRTYNNLGLVFAVLNRPLEALDAFQQALRVNPNNLYALTSLGMVLVNIKRFAEAQPILERALKIDADNGRVLYHLALCYVNFGKKDRAVGLLKRARKLYPNDNAIAESLRHLL